MIKDDVIKISKRVTYEISLGLGNRYRLDLSEIQSEFRGTIRFSTSEREHVDVTNDGMLIAAGVGDATITVYDEVETRVLVTVDSANAGTFVPVSTNYPVNPNPAKKEKIKVLAIKVHVFKANYLFSPDAFSCLPIYIRRDHRCALIERRIASCHELIDAMRNSEKRHEMIRSLQVDDYTTRLWFRQSCLFEVPGMSADFAFLAASAGVRNVQDLQNSSSENLWSVFFSLESAAHAFVDSEGFIMPNRLQFDAILRAAKQISLQSSDYNIEHLTDDPEPTYLFVSQRGLKSDSEVLAEALRALNEIPLTLPLPKTISGYVKMKEEHQNDEDAVAKCGLKVSLSGIANPGADRSEDDEDISAYTDGTGKFCIVMPDRYNMQETITFTIRENTSDSTFAFAQTAEQGANGTHEMKFIKRASEIMNHLNIEVSTFKSGAEQNFADIFSGTGTIEDYYTIRTVPARLVLELYDRFTALASQKIELEQTIFDLATNEYDKACAKNRLDALRKAFLDSVHALKEEIAYHIDEKECQLDEAKRERTKAVAAMVDDIKYHQHERLQHLQTQKQKAEETLSVLAEAAAPNVNDGEIPTLENSIKSIVEEINIIQAEKLFQDAEIKRLIRLHLENNEADIEQNEIVAFDKVRIPKRIILKHMKRQLSDCEFCREYKQRYEEACQQIEMLTEELAQLTTELELTEEEYQRLLQEHAAGCDSAVPDSLTTSSEDLFGLQMERLAYGVLENCRLFEKKRLEYERSKKDFANAEYLYARYTATEEAIIHDTLFEDYLKKHAEDKEVLAYNKSVSDLDGFTAAISDLDETTDDIAQTLRNILSSNMDCDMGTFILIQNLFEAQESKPRALPSVRLMGDGTKAVYLPTDTAPSRIFNYSMLQRLVEPAVSINNVPYQRAPIDQAIDIMDYKEKLYCGQKEIPVASSLGIGYVLNMHQAWVPDGFALGSLLYSLVLAPGEEQRLIVQERSEAYTVDDTATALDTINDSYQNRQTDNETAAFEQAADRFSSAHSDYEYSSTAKSNGGTSIGILFGIGVTSKSSSSNYGSGSSNSSQSDHYGEVSNAAQNFQTEIKTESERIAAAQRTSIRVASSSESESVASKIIANHNHSHVMTVQYWEVNRRYRMETCIEGIDLVLFVPLKMVNFLPEITTASQRNLNEYKEYLLPANCFQSFSKDAFNFRYSSLLRYSDTIYGSLPYQYRGGMNLVKKYASLPNWKIQTASTETTVFRMKLVGNFMEFDQIRATAHFGSSNTTLEGNLINMDYLTVDPSMNTRERVRYALKKLRNGIKVSREQFKAKDKRVRMENGIEQIIPENDKAILEFEFYVPSSLSKNDISYISLENSIMPWTCNLSQDTEYMELYEKDAITNYEAQLKNFYQDDTKSGNDMRRVEHYSTGLPECYTDPYVTFSASELRNLGGCPFKVYFDMDGKDTGSTVTRSAGEEEDGASSGWIFTLRSQYDDRAAYAGILSSSPIRVTYVNSIPHMTYNEFVEIENMFRHVVSNSLRYSQEVWSSLTTNERILMLEQYTIDMNYNSYQGFVNDNSAMNERITIPLLNCVNAKKLLGFYGNCMLLPFTYPQELADKLGKTASQIQDELFRYHTTNFRVPSTVISVPTSGMIGEAVLGETNVSEKIDITRFWNWKDSDIDHMEISQNALGSHSLLDNANTLTVDAPTVGVTPTEHISGGDLAAALLARSQPTWADVLANTDIRDLLKSTDTNASNGRETMLNTNADVLKTTITTAADLAKAAASAGLTGGTSLIGDTDVIKGALSGLGLGDGDVSSLLSKITGGKTSTSDLLSNLSSLISKGDNSTPKEGDSGLGGAQGSGVDYNNDGTKQDIPKENGETDTEPLKASDDLENLILYFKNGLSNSTDPVTLLNDWLNSKGYDYVLSEEEIKVIAKNYCSLRGEDFSEIIKNFQDTLL